MNELLYTAQDLAIILIGMDLDCRIESAVMDRIWNREKEFLAEPYRQDRRRFTLEVLYWRHYFSEKTTLDRELPVVQKDLESGAIRWTWNGTTAIIPISICSSKVSGSGACMGWGRSMCASSCGLFWLCMDTAGVPVC